MKNKRIVTDIIKRKKNKVVDKVSNYQSLPYSDDNLFTKDSRSFKERVHSQLNIPKNKTQNNSNEFISIDQKPTKAKRFYLKLLILILIILIIFSTKILNKEKNSTTNINNLKLELESENRILEQEIDSLYQDQIDNEDLLNDFSEKLPKTNLTQKSKELDNTKKELSNEINVLDDSNDSENTNNDIINFSN